MTKLIITENLISDINQIKSEINIDESIVSISQEEFTANNTAALFQSDNFQFVSDSFVTYSDLKKMNYDFKYNKKKRGLNIIDYGGSLGSMYFKFKDIINQKYKNTN